MSDFFAMGGYGFYVWGSYGAALLIVGGLAGLSWCSLRASASRLEALRQAAPHRRRKAPHRRHKESGHGAQ
ncbi:heme exporter protein CcmD [Govanella unica]|uniref:Heme exporter protein D n=1 Tax=Govanella unica TaxID=2975056 RepID=A0A9X3TVD6_9PROT|nr:heme exporter protein CcmD [Govania unica]MDA5192711.1 heme exporter protein CcmD [Govania unica]